MTKRYKTVAKKYLMVFATAVALLSSCKVNDDDFFELRDRNGIDAAIWNTEGSVQMHLNRAYDVVMPQFLFQDHNTNNMNGRYGVHFASDENFFPAADQWARAALGLQGELGNNDIRFAGNVYTGNAGGNKYMDIARCNDAIANIPGGTMAPALKRSFLGQYYALRAMVYFELVKVYGGVPLVLTPQSPDNLTVSGRASARECFQTITNDLDSAITNLNGIVWDDASGRGKLDKLAATCLKAKVLLYWASPQFNPGNDASRWATALEANKTAYDLAVSSGRVLLPNYASIFQTEGTANTETIIVRTYSSTLERRGHDGERRSRPSSEGGSPNQGYRATTRLLDAYPMLDGNPIGSPGQYTYDDVMFWQNRDPRFNATIAYNGGIWALSGKATRKQWTYTGAISEANLMPVYCKRFTTPALTAAASAYTNNIGGNGMDWIEMRFAEVILNYADCANETGNLSLAKDMVRKIRERAGIKVGATPANDFGLGSVTTAARMRDLILNERMVEFAFENKRNSDLRRTRRMHLLTGNMTSIEIEVIGGTNVRNALEVVVNPTTGDRFRETLNLENKAVYSQYFRKNIVGVQGYLPYNIPEFHYFYTFNTDFVNTGANIQATIGWAGGTFDPLAN
ncbi:RagB/SusD family nutrient uptake outer membrane protein [Pedobacter heparinus]|uniref:RagB/SusD family nutrient uptake outer membrane protein n=1 Tax=Pedobacter heparinus TaxID=984 RepID=UPI00292FF2F0|nr:RagB/SusD family nutrient uptake outer membrane protein [Pedobacter heparinus]